jgi:hypothetical protein
VSTPDEQALFKLAIARSDVHAACVACDHLLAIDDPPYTLYSTLVAAIVVSYARPFSQNRPLGPLPEQWGRFDDPARQKLHNEILEARNRLVAHSDLSERAVWVVPAGVELPNGTKRDHPTIVVRTPALRSDRVNAIRDLCLDLLGRLSEEIDELRGRTFPDASLGDDEIELRFDE